MKITVLLYRSQAQFGLVHKRKKYIGVTVFGAAMIVTIEKKPLG